MNIKIRPMTMDDVPRVAAVHVAAWQRSFRGFLSKRYLDGLSVDECQWVHIRDLTDADPNWCLCVAEDLNGNLLGFCKGAPLRKPFEDYDCELVSLYIHPDHQAHGIGKALFFHVINHLSQHHYKNLLLWVISRTKGVGFYQSLGGTTITHKYENLDSARLVHGVGFRDLKQYLHQRHTD